MVLPSCYIVLYNLYIYIYIYIYTYVCIHMYVHYIYVYIYICIYVFYLRVGEGAAFGFLVLGPLFGTTLNWEPAVATCGLHVPNLATKVAPGICQGLMRSHNNTNNVDIKMGCRKLL